MLFKISVFVSFFREESPYRITWVIWEWFKFKILGAICLMLFSRVFRYASKIGQNMRQWQGDSISDPQAQIGFNMSKKLCLNLPSRRWLRPSLILERYLIALGLWQLETLFGFDCINFKILDLNKLKLFRFRMSESSLFYSAITDGKKEFLKKLCFILNCGML